MVSIMVMLKMVVSFTMRNTVKRRVERVVVVNKRTREVKKMNRRKENLLMLIQEQTKKMNRFLLNMIKLKLKKSRLKTRKSKI